MSFRACHRSVFAVFCALSASIFFASSISHASAIFFETAAGADGDDFVTANGALFEGIDWTNPAQVDPLDSNSWVIDTDNSPFASAIAGTRWLQGFAQGAQNRAKLAWDGVHPLSFSSIELRTRHISDTGSGVDGNLDGVDDRWLTTVILRFRDVNNDESLHVVALDAVEDWILVKASDVGGAADLTQLKAIFFEGDSGTAIPDVLNDRFAIDNLQFADCADGIDNDGDGGTDHPLDIGCRVRSSARENPQCQDGINNDASEDALIDFDGGASAGVPLAQQTAPDLQCNGLPYRNRERVAPLCGLGFEAAPFLIGLLALRRRRQRS